MSAVVYCLFPCCPPSDDHHCLLLLRCINVDVQHCHATSHQLPLHSAAPWQSSRGRSLHQKSRPSPLLLPHLHPFTALFIPANRHYLIWHESMMTKHFMGKMCSNSREPLLISVCVYLSCSCLNIRYVLTHTDYLRVYPHILPEHSRGPQVCEPTTQSLPSDAALWVIIVSSNSWAPSPPSPLMFSHHPSIRPNTLQ